MTCPCKIKAYLHDDCTYSRLNKEAWSSDAPAKYLNKPTVRPPTVGGSSVTSRLDCRDSCRAHIPQATDWTGACRNAQWRMERMVSLKTTTPAPVQMPMPQATSSTAASGSSPCATSLLPFPERTKRHYSTQAVSGLLVAWHPSQVLMQGCQFAVSPSLRISLGTLTITIRILKMKRTQQTLKSKLGFQSMTTPLCLTVRLHL